MGGYEDMINYTFMSQKRARKIHVWNTIDVYAILAIKISKPSLIHG